MKILHINSVCKVGSTGKIVYNLHKYLEKEGHASLVCYGKGKLYPEERSLIRISSKFEVYLHVFLTRLFGTQGVYSFFATKKLIDIIKNYKPDVVQLFNLHGYYINEFKLLNFLKKNGIKTIYSMLDEYPYMGKCCYSYDCNKFERECYQCPQVKAYPKSIFIDSSNKLFKLKKKSYDNIDDIVFTGPPWVVQRAGNSALLKNKTLSVIDEPIDFDRVFYPRNASQLRKTLDIPDDTLIVLTVAPFSNPRKGGIYFIELARFLENENITFIFIGYDGTELDLPRNLIPIGFVSNQDDLAAYYSLADIFVCTSLADTMPNVCLEALGCGTPVCGFNVSGTPFVTTKEFGVFTPVGDIEKLATVIRNTPKKTEKRSSSCREYALGRYSMKVIFSKFLDLYSRRYPLQH